MYAPPQRATWLAPSNLRPRYICDCVEWDVVGIGCGQHQALNHNRGAGKLHFSDAEENAHFRDMQQKFCLYSL
jgi:hypothetical protein